MRRVGLAVALVLALTTAANASIVYHFVALNAVGPNFEWTYQANLAEDQKIDTLAPPPALASFGTIFDFPGVISASSTVNPPLVGAISVSTSTPPTSTQAFSQSVTDNPAILNVVTDITGSFTPAPGSGQTQLYSVTIVSSVGGPVVLGPLQSGQALKNSPGTPSDNAPAGNTTSVEGPGPQQVVPEPGTLLLLGTSLVGLGGYARARMRRKK